MKNPLNKRVFREMRGDFGKYTVIFLTLVLFIGMVSGFLVAADSMIYAYNESFTKYNVEDGHFETQESLNKAQIRKLEELDIKLYDIPYIEEKLDSGSELRIFANRKEVDRACLMKGEFPENANEIAIDRMFADNNKLKVGDTIKSKSHEYKIVGLVALSDYSTLFKSNSDTMFDSVLFGVALVSDKMFQTYDEDYITPAYAWKYNNPPKDKDEEVDMSE
nr:ABC transporter permease [Lachnospiraceae bacterium]